jgi:hypothetical protein
LNIDVIRIREGTLDKIRKIEGEHLKKENEKLFNRIRKSYVLCLY